jgi:hypothetical protein
MGTMAEPVLFLGDSLVVSRLRAFFAISRGVVFAAPNHADGGKRAVVSWNDLE